LFAAVPALAIFDFAYRRFAFDALDLALRCRSETQPAGPDVAAGLS
jgi:hypothetical protein